MDHSGRRRRRHAYNFDEFATRQWPLDIPYIFNDTVPTTVAGKSRISSLVRHQHLT